MLQRHFWGRIIAILASCIFILTSSVLMFVCTISITRRESNEPSEKVYSFIDNDFPEHWPLNLPNVLMIMEESSHYGISGLDSREEWATTATYGFGYLRLGQEQRRFALSMWHQLHCLRLMRTALDGDYGQGVREHMQHCLAYFRQMILCNPDLTLEPADMLTRNYEIQRTGATHVCKDWSKVYDAMGRNYNDTRL
ncbi:hypothetical protein EDD18DRAFT_1145962 [Armillaria luteobubalina]|uniref:Oxidase ustYa n=1 Tax=Armillaria luteobubalina TaxID=153913 RepID=A0AA39QEX6_9AGAR|nr:hypothetical protein EDD18DRAFT_1145962 [Armillaria luteobubalina]